MPRGKSHQSLALIDAAREILAGIQPATVRAVCYKLFTLGLIGDMSKNETNKVSRALTWAREHDELDWNWIVDETRRVEQIASWANLAEFTDIASRSFRRDSWQCQPYHVEVWSEKGTVRGTLAPVLKQFGVAFRVFHGYGSATSVYQAASDSLNVEREAFIAFYVGDWDPSGLHMSEVDLPNRLLEYGGSVDLRRIALVQEDLPRLPSFSLNSKRRDSRCRWYWNHCRSQRCWELDAMDPNTLRNRLRRAIEDVIDWEAWERSRKAEEAEQESLKTVIKKWNSISRQASI